MKVLPNKAFQPTREKTRAAEGRDVSHPMPDLADNKPSAFRLLQSEGALLAAIPFAGSVIALAFEAGYLSFFDVPVTLLQLDFTRIVTASAVVALLSIFLLIPLTLVAAVARGPHPVRRALLKPLVHALFFGTIIYFTPGPEGHGGFFSDICS